MSNTSRDFNKSAGEGTVRRFRSFTAPGVLLAGAAGAGAALLVLYAGYLVVSLLNPLNILPNAGPTAAIGVVLGVSLAHLGPQLQPQKGLAAGIGLAAGALWLGLTLATGVVLPLTFVVSTLAMFTVAALFMRTVFSGVNVTQLRKDHVESVVIRLVRGTLLAALTLIVALPFIFMVSLSFKTRAAYLADPTNLSVNILQPIPELLSGFIEVLVRFNFGLYIINSTGIALLTVVITVTTGILGAYAVTRLRFPGQRFLSKAILLIYMFPAIVLVIPLYTVFTQLGLRDTRQGLLIVYAAMTIPVALYMLRSYFQTLPADLEESGLIDGCSRGQVIWRITIPLSGPAIASVGLYVFMIAWNEFLFAFMFLDTPAIFTLSRGMMVLDDMEGPRQLLMAGATTITVPIMVLFFRFQRYLVGGLTAGSVKG